MKLTVPNGMKQLQLDNMLGLAKVRSKVEQCVIRAARAKIFPPALKEAFALPTKAGDPASYRREIAGQPAIEVDLADAESAALKKALVEFQESQGFISDDADYFYGLIDQLEALEADV